MPLSTLTYRTETPVNNNKKFENSGDEFANRNMTSNNIEDEHTEVPKIYSANGRTDNHREKWLIQLRGLRNDRLQIIHFVTDGRNMEGHSKDGNEVVTEFNLIREHRKRS
jgi:hypothetical protein